MHLQVVIFYSEDGWVLFRGLKGIFTLEEILFSYEKCIRGYLATKLS